MTRYSFETEKLAYDCVVYIKLRANDRSTVRHNNTHAGVDSTRVKHDLGCYFGWLHSADWYFRGLLILYMYPVILLFLSYSCLMNSGCIVGSLGLIGFWRCI